MRRNHSPCGCISLDLYKPICISYYSRGSTSFHLGRCEQLILSNSGEQDRGIVVVRERKELLHWRFPQLQPDALFLEEIAAWRRILPDSVAASSFWP
jgi:hypothetical protein